MNHFDRNIDAAQMVKSKVPVGSKLIIAMRFFRAAQKTAATGKLDLWALMNELVYGLSAETLK